MSAVPTTDPLAKLNRAGLTSLHEVLLWTPRKHIDYTQVIAPEELHEYVEQKVVLELTVSASPRPGKNKGQFVAWGRDNAGREHRLTLFGMLKFSPWKTIGVGARIHVLAKVVEFNQNIYLNQVELVPHAYVRRVLPVYGGKPGVIAGEAIFEHVMAALATPHAITDACTTIRQAFDGQSEGEILNRTQVSGSLAQILNALHRPESMNEAQWGLSSAKRIATAYIKHSAQRASERPLRVQTVMRIGVDEIETLIRQLPFVPTQGERSQVHAIHEIVRLLGQPTAMDAILTADVGVGKTLCYMIPAVAAQTHGFKVCVLVPNTILAKQIATEFETMFPDCPVALATDETRKTPIDWERNPVVIGTTRVFAVSKRAKWHPNLLIIDEQQKLSIDQRQTLCTPDTNVLEASATPIPQTLGLLQHGGKDRIVVDVRHSKQDIRTYVVGADRRQRMFARLQEAVRRGVQVAVIYPRVQASGDDDAKSVISAGARFEKLCPGQVITIHGKMTGEEKLAAMEQAKSGEKAIIVGSSILEIGITIANLRMMIVVNADRYGVSTLHQLRGRLARHGGVGEFFAFLPDEVEQETLDRINLLAMTNNGFELADLDMRQRGFGDLSGDSTDTSGRTRTLFRGIQFMPDDFERLLRETEG